MSAQSEPFFVVVQGRKLEVQRIPGSAHTLVFLHEGLGSVAMWRDFPLKAAHATGCSAVVYSRYGYGQSDVLREARRVDYMHAEALEVLPELLRVLEVPDPVLVGHSDGGSIALIYASAHPKVKGLVVMAPHVFVEDISVKSIAEARTAFETTDLAQKLGRHHADPAKTFWGWNDIWLHPDFRRWNIEEVLPRIRCPMLAIQGFDDEYGTMAQLDAIARQTGGPIELLRLTACKHSPHRDQPDAVLQAFHLTQEQVEEANGPGYWRLETGLDPEQTNGWLVLLVRLNWENSLLSKYRFRTGFAVVALWWMAVFAVILATIGWTTTAHLHLVFPYGTIA